MADLAIQDITVAGTEVAFVAAAAGGDKIANNRQGERTFLRVRNGDASDKTVTINSQQPCDQGFDHDIAEVVTAGEERDIGPLDDARFNDVNGDCLITYSGVTAVTVAAIKLP